MSLFRDPYDGERSLACACGRHERAADHDAAVTDARPCRAQRCSWPRLSRSSRAIASAAASCGAVGAPTAMAAHGIALPLRRARGDGQDKGAIEKKDLKVGFIPITCATPLIMSAPARLLREAGPQRDAGEDRRLGADPRQGDEQGVRRLAPAGADAARDGARRGLRRDADERATIQNSNGQAITLA
jgi:nitrate/nitrite transport system substrate-binding protein